MPSATDYRQPGRSALQVSPICLAALDLRLDADGDAFGDALATRGCTDPAYPLEGRPLHGRARPVQSGALSARAAARSAGWPCGNRARPG